MLFKKMWWGWVGREGGVRDIYYPNVPALLY